MKKSYNPFNIWESYVGAVIYFLLALLSSQYSQTEFTLYFSSILIKMFESENGNIPMIIDKIGILVILVQGFLIGWAIHSLFRYFSKRRRR